MIYAIDLDGVVIDWDGGFRKAWNEMYPAHQIPPYSRTWESPFEDTGLSHTAFWRWIDDNEIYRGLPEIPGAVCAIWTLEELGHTINYVTNRHERAAALTEEWLYDHGIWHPTWHRSDKTEHVADVYVDDNNDNLKAYVAAHPTKDVYRVIRPWNEGIAGTKAIYSLLELV